MTSDTLHRFDHTRPTQPNPHMMECNDYLLWTLTHQRDPIIRHGKQAIETLIAETCGYNALPAEHKAQDMNSRAAKHALMNAGNTHGIHAKKSSYPAWQKPRQGYAESNVSRTSSRAASESGYSPGSPSRSQRNNYPPEAPQRRPGYAASDPGQTRRPQSAGPS